MSISKSAPELAKKGTLWLIVILAFSFTIKYIFKLNSSSNPGNYAYTIGSVRMISDSSWEISFRINDQSFIDTSITEIIHARIFVRFNTANLYEHYYLRDTIPSNEANLQGKLLESLAPSQYLIEEK